MSRNLRKKIADQQADEELEELCLSKEEEIHRATISGIIQKAIDDVDSDLEKREKTVKKTKTYLRTGTNPDAGLKQILAATKRRSR